MVVVAIEVVGVVSVVVVVVVVVTACHSAIHHHCWVIHHISINAAARRTALCQESFCFLGSCVFGNLSLWSQNALG